MKCESCECEMRIVGSVLKVTGDNNADEQTKVYRVQTLKCLNRSCPRPQETQVEIELEHI